MPSLTDRPPRPGRLAGAACGAALLAGCVASGGSDAELAALRAENVALRAQLAASEPAPAASAELAADLRLENRRLEQLAGLTAKGRLVESEDARFRSVHDPATGRTTVLSGRLPAESDAAIDLAGYAVAVGFTHPGEALSDADRPVAPLFLLVETARSAGSRLASTREAGLGDASLPLLSYEVLREREPPAGRGRGRGRSGGAGTLDERLSFGFPRDAARAFARSDGMDLRLPGLTLRLTRDHAALARAALLRSE